MALFPNGILCAISEFISPVINGATFETKYALDRFAKNGLTLTSDKSEDSDSSEDNKD